MTKRGPFKDFKTPPETIRLAADALRISYPPSSRGKVSEIAGTKVVSISANRMAM